MRNIDKKWALFAIATIFSFYGIFYTLINTTFAVEYVLPIDKHFDDMNFYECVVDSYNLEFSMNMSYDQVLDYEKLKKLRIPENVKIEPFINDLPSLMKVTDLMITRAGASTMSEILALNIPSIFIPSPYVTNNHQYKNAMDLVNKNAGLILEEKDLTKDNLINLIDKTLSNKEHYQNIKNNLKELGIKDSSSRIYEVLKEMIIDDKKFF